MKIKRSLTYDLIMAAAFFYLRTLLTYHHIGLTSKSPNLVFLIPKFGTSIFNL